jgi:TolA-binding protein
MCVHELYNRGYAHSLQGDHAAAIADYTAVVDSYSADAAPAIRPKVAEALYARGYAHGQQGQNAAGIADYTLVVERYSADSDPAIREQVAEARELAKLAD